MPTSTTRRGNIFFMLFASIAMVGAVGVMGMNIMKGPVRAMALSGGLWTLKDNDTQTATISKNLSVTDMGGDEQLSFDADTKAFSIGAGARGGYQHWGGQCRRCHYNIERQ